MIRFYKRKNTLHVSYYEDDQRIRKSTGITVDGWNQKKQMAFGDNADSINERLSEIRYEVSNKKTLDKIYLMDVSGEYCNEKYSAFGERLAERTRIGRRTVHNHLAKFEEDTGMSLNIGYCNKYNSIEKHKKMEVINDYAYELKEYFSSVSKSTLSQYMKYVCSVLNFGKKKYDVEIDQDIFKVKQPTYDVDVLGVEDFKTFIEKSYESYKDKGAFVCLLTAMTGARISEILSWTHRNNIVDGNIVYLPLKNKKHQRGSITIPIDQQLQQVIDYHRKNNKKNDYVFYGYAYSMTRLYFKSFCDTLDFMSTEKTKIRLDANDNVIQDRKPLKDIITIHKIRGSFISNMAMSGVSHETVKYFSGHKQDSRSFARYVGVDKTHAKDSYNNFANKVSNSNNFSTLSVDDKERYTSY